MKFERIKPGMTLYDVHRYKVGNTARSSVGVWPVRVVEVDQESRSIVASWNHNPPRRFHEHQTRKLREREPTLVYIGFGACRLASREEAKAAKLAKERS